MSNETKGQDENLDLQAILKKAEQQTSFPDVPLDEFEPPTYDEWKEACVALGFLTAEKFDEVFHPEEMV